MRVRAGARYKGSGSDGEGIKGVEGVVFVLGAEGVSGAEAVARGGYVKAADMRFPELL